MQPLLQAPAALRDLQNHVLPYLPTDGAAAGGNPFTVSLPHLPSLPSVETQQEQKQVPPVSNGVDESPSIASLPHLPFLPSVDTQQKQNQDPPASDGAVGSPSTTSLPHLPSLPSDIEDLQENISSHLPSSNGGTTTGSPPTIDPLPSLPPPSHHPLLPHLSSLALILNGLDMAGKAVMIAKDPTKMLALPKLLIVQLEKFFTSQPMAVKLLLLSGLMLLSGLAVAILFSTPVLIVLSLLLAPAFAAVAVAATGFVLAVGFSVALVFAMVWAYNYTTGRRSLPPAWKLELARMTLVKKAEDVRKR